MIGILWKGFLIGVATSAPVGPVGAMCIHHTLSGGRRRGLSAGLGAATADAIYATVAIFGLQFIATFVTGNQFWFRLVGGILLILLGLRFLLREPHLEAKKSWDAHLGAFGTAFMITLTNPLTLGVFAMLFAGFGLMELSTRHQEVSLVSSVFIGSVSWWLCLSIISHVFRARISHSKLAWLSRIPGAFMLIFGLVVLFSLWFGGR
jgi:threonine/homoserine/homoserine lactone efflux protein